MANPLLTLGQLLHGAEAELKAGRSAIGRTWGTGFGLLDQHLGGGLHAGELTLLGGPQGLGKTTFALQLLRNIVAAGGTGLYFSFEHDPPTILQRVLGLEAAQVGGEEAAPLAFVRAAMSPDGEGASLFGRLESTPGGAAAIAAVEAYGDRLQIHRSSGASTDVQTIASCIREAAVTDAPVVVVDYLQKVAVPGGPDVEAERVTQIVEGLKDLALAEEVPILAIVAADKEGLVTGKRLRISHLRGSSALAYEPDVVLVLNEKYDVVARHHLVYDVSNAERFRDWAVLTIEKNRGGLDGVDLELRKRFEQGCFEVDVQPVAEQLVDERVFVE